MTIFFAADTHFQHTKIFESRGFSSLEEHDNTLVDNWNKVVGENDKVFLVGDVIFGGSEPDYSILRALKGKIFLVCGNHDTRVKINQMSQIFYAVLGSHEITQKKIVTHIPVHGSQLERWTHNIHGHLHGDKINDPRYICVSMEHINMTPVAYDELFK